MPSVQLRLRVMTVPAVVPEPSPSGTRPQFFACAAPGSSSEGAERGAESQRPSHQCSWMTRSISPYSAA